MGESAKSVIVATIFFSILLAGYIRLFFKRKTRKDKFIEKAKAAGHCATGIVVKNKIAFGNDESGNSYFRNDRMKVVYEYKVGGKAYRKKLVFQSPGMVSVQYPYQIDVYYNPKNPAKGVCKEEISEDRSGSCLGTILLAVVSCVILCQLLKML